ncbi:glycerophosphodiester phosphodiesterase family protein [Lacinutrix sp. C3R15]|uniref:glycerophosphodiester phosphodiesterase family protein n=1 Tax=Flavobacteriaceae TaxID=49546 RepID=UPI001C088835|nr:MULTISPECIES: glycerophosphodiester phosphodiesterase family protein [Flavobacteriaceae]MBU2938831.1 glycerophosphodiester phosphodiesterase family protein [Lacinutrix sp. C3R15]MDO6622144.1 glycerophosphodiester phosphodiesterase family protein [Oceanihabitans sp. 1_MG-2023]
MHKQLYFILLFVLVVSCKKNVSEASTTNEVVQESNKKSVLIKTFKYQPNADAIISVHRGGKSIANYPENAIETLAYVYNRIPTAIFEIDVAKTKDNQLVLLHDNTLDRTTTGTGKLTDYTYQELQAFYLEDDFENQTSFKIPLFSSVLKWAKANKVVLTVDIKRSVAVETVIDAIRAEKAEDVCVIITYDLKQAEKAYKLAPELLLSVSARNEKELDWLLHSNIPTENMLAFTGTRLSADTFYKKVQSYGIKTILGTLGNLDKQAEAKGENLYKVWQNKGIDVFATDRPFAAAKALGVTK